MIEKTICGRVFALPEIQVGNGSSEISMYRGNFKVREKSIRWTTLTAEETPGGAVYRTPGTEIRLSLSEKDCFLTMELSIVSGSWNRFRLCFRADHSEAVFGGGEQFSYFNLRGHRFPIMTRE